uniref:AGE family epimerase/isomerase n=1 Tax=Pedobacter schmidteae TaxID=2201271 RepID=UPI000EAEBA34|nr:AGE family epimerase/isomerase [Pedobacter schmidteae]
MVSIRSEIEKAMADILRYWCDKTPDHVQGGFIGRIDETEKADPVAPKGAVLNARILWTFSAAFEGTGLPTYKTMADRAYSYIIKHFVDQEFGGVYWTVTAVGKPSDTKKQIYALSFMIYGLAAYYKITKAQPALETAVKLFKVIEKYSYDKQYGGYFEAFNRDWTNASDLRLSEKDANEKKTMNTHLHILEAYTTLYSVYPDELLKIQIRGLLNCFDQYIIDPETKHLKLFMNEAWKASGDEISYGHDIEASWLLLEAAETIKDEALILRFKSIAISLATAASEGLEADGSIIYEYIPAKGLIIKEKHWWVQAEALVGFLNVWQITGQQKYFDHFSNCWTFIDQHLIDKKEGEWFWGVESDGTVMKDQDKAGLWKCPYHNTRACIEVLKRLSVTAGTAMPVVS